MACVECLWNNTFFIGSQFRSISSVSTVSFCFQGNHISKEWYHFGGWNTLEAFEVKNTHKFSTAGFFNKQGESDVTICIQIGPSFLRYQLLKTHFCLAVGFFEGVKNPVIYIIDGDISIPTTESTEILLWYHSKWVLFFSGVLFLIFFYFISENISSTISVCWLSLYLQVSGHVSLFIGRKTHRIPIFWLHNKVKCVKSLHSHSRPHCGQCYFILGENILISLSLHWSRLWFFHLLQAAPQSWV